MVCARNFLIDAVRKEKAAIRRPTQPLLSLDALREATGQAFEPADDDGPEQAFRDAWRRDVLDRAFATVQQLSRTLQRDTDLNIFLAYYLSENECADSWDELAVRFGLANGKQAFNKADWVKRQLVRAIRQQIRTYVENENEVDDELRQFKG